MVTNGDWRIEPMPQGLVLRWRGTARRREYTAERVHEDSYCVKVEFFDALNRRTWWGRSPAWKREDAPLQEIKTLVDSELKDLNQKILN